ncbi:hypothetical protein EYC84_010356 [Monilinia fructicola]|uniref:Uncharacterized protein n=1 Tax=Monilinia fructicola TaxID=38448 RepID=A0A5M9JJS5_MONFR|nr:hypothetical protein EYC84_010356 [Monilinia fructicola]
MNFIKKGRVQDPIEAQSAHVNWRQLSRAMLVEQARHLPGGEVHAQDPWPPRIFTDSDLQDLWRRNFETIQKVLPSRRVAGVIFARQLHDLPLQSDDDIEAVYAALALLRVREWPQVDDEEFWDEFEKHFGDNHK